MEMDAHFQYTCIYTYIHTYIPTHTSFWQRIGDTRVHKQRNEDESFRSEETFRSNTASENVVAVGHHGPTRPPQV